MKKNWKSLAATTVALTLITLSGTHANAAITNDLDDLDVEIKYGNKKVDIDYEVKSYFFGLFTRTEAKYVNTVNNETLTGSKAESKIKSIFNSVDIKSDTQEDIATKVLAQTKTDATYTKFDFEAEYTNGQSRKFKLTPSSTGNGTTTNDTTIVDFDLDVKYGVKEVELDYEVKSSRIDAKIKNELTGQTYTGASAQTAIEQLLAGLDFANATQDATINYLITQLGLGTDYTKFDFEIKYANGRKVEFEAVGAPTTSSTSSSNNNTSSTSSSATESTSSSSSAAPVVTNNENLIDLEIEIKYPANKKYDVEYEVKRNGYKAKYQDTVTGEYTTGAAARTKVLELTDGINLSTATQDQVIQHVLTKLGASADYIEFEAELKFTNSPTVKFEVKQAASNASTADIGLAKAKEIAFNHAGTTEAAVRLKKAKADYEDGIKEYEIEFVVNGYEYDYTIDASTGRITDYDKERN